MRFRFVLIVISVGGTSGCGGCCHAMTPAPVSNQPLGGPCADSTECAAGLSCEGAPGRYAGTTTTAYPGQAESRATNACTISCTGACSPGAACVPGVGMDICLPTCLSDADCQTSTRAGTCVTQGTGDRVCIAIVCGECPSGYFCDLQGECLPPGASSGASLPSWCRHQ